MNNNFNKGTKYIVTTKGTFNIYLCQQTKKGFTGYDKKGRVFLFDNKQDQLVIGRALKSLNLI